MEAAQKNHHRCKDKAAAGPDALMLHPVDNPDILHPAAEHRHIGNHANVIPKAGTTGNGADR